VTVGLAMALDDIEVVFNAVGAICATSIGMLLPCYFYVRLTKINPLISNIIWPLLSFA
jgi:amino acid permease